MKKLKTFEGFIDLFGDEYKVGEIYFDKSYLETDPMSICVVSRKPEDYEIKYWVWQIGSKYENKLLFFPIDSVREVDLFYPNFITPSRKEKQEIKNHIVNNLQSKNIKIK